MKTINDVVIQLKIISLTLAMIMGLLLSILVQIVHAYTLIPYSTVPCDAGTITIGLPILPGS